jgi:hypothetical protein
VPPALAHAYAQAAEAAGDPVGVIEIPDAGHFELVDPTSHAWDAVRQAVLDLCGITSDG